nr:4Fe-4S dicluster domain-containing protein [Bacteroidota bacterium]
MKDYWKSIDEKNLRIVETKQKEIEPEFSIVGLSSEDVKLRSTRRDFLKICGYTAVSAAILSSCETPVRKAIPYLIQPEEITPGIANYYASTYFDGNDYCSILVKTREGRPIKIEGNELSGISRGGTMPKIQASVLNLYDTARYTDPLIDKAKTSWEQIDSDIKKELNNISTKEGNLIILASTVISPSTKQLFGDFKEKYPGTEIIYYDAVSSSAILSANKLSFDRAVIPEYKFDQAQLIVGFNADFLGTWIMPVEFTKQYSQRRDLTNGETSISRHIQFESIMSLTGSNADERYAIKPSEEAILLLNLYNALAVKINSPTYKVKASSLDVSQLAEELWENKGKSLVVSGTNSIPVQVIVNAINSLLNNYENTIHINHAVLVKQAHDKDVLDVVKRMNDGDVDGLIFYNTNPLYDFPDVENFKNGLSQVGLTISLAETADETSDACKYVCPDNNFLESWNDAEPKEGYFSLAQPAINKLYNTRCAQDSFLSWIDSDSDYYSYIQNYWKENLFNKQDKYPVFRTFWNHCLQNGVLELKEESQAHPDFKLDVTTYFDELVKSHSKATHEGLELIIYETIAIGNGKHANNPWLQELPDAISKVTWDNYVAVSPKYAKAQGIENEDVVIINDQIELPVIVQVGQPEGTIAIAMGYGRTVAGRVAKNIGQNSFGFTEFVDDLRQYSVTNIQLTKTKKTYPLALTQSHHSMEGRGLIREATLSDYLKNPSSGNEEHEKAEEEAVTLYKKPDYKGHHWALAIDLNKCSGCGNCVLACQVENNVAVIGKEEVRNRRIMHWIRIDRYFEGEEDRPAVVHQPVMCQHCDNAPCENVCPVAATSHSDEGLNQMTYNRCIGTRYCMNNCPYRVRRFNWYDYSDSKNFEYNLNNDVEKMALNPDVTVRSRGIVEKCTFCLQRIQEKKLNAKKENRTLKDGEIKTACAQTCPSNAIVFGDLNDKNSQVSKLFKDPRSYHLL